MKFNLFETVKELHILSHRKHKDTRDILFSAIGHLQEATKLEYEHELLKIQLEHAKNQLDNIKLEKIYLEEIIKEKSIVYLADRAGVTYSH